MSFTQPSDAQILQAARQELQLAREQLESQQHAQAQEWRNAMAQLAADARQAEKERAKETEEREERRAKQAEEREARSRVELQELQHKLYQERVEFMGEKFAWERKLATVQAKLDAVNGILDVRCALEVALARWGEQKIKPSRKGASTTSLVQEFVNCAAFSRAVARCHQVLPLARKSEAIKAAPHLYATISKAVHTGSGDVLDVTRYSGADGLALVSFLSALQEEEMLEVGTKVAYRSRQFDLSKEGHLVLRATAIGGGSGEPTGPTQEPPAVPELPAPGNGGDGGSGGGGRRKRRRRRGGQRGSDQGGQADRSDQF